MHTRVTYTAIILLAVMYSCKKPYMPVAVALNANALVIEGVINAGNDSTLITLSRTTKLDEGFGIRTETGAQVTVEAENGTIYPLREIKNGIYASAPLGLDTAQRHRLRVTIPGKVYLSDYVQTCITPLLEKVGYAIKDDKVDITVDTRGGANSTHYYRWECDQTWEFNTNFISYFKGVSGSWPVARDQQREMVYHCWANEKPANILLGSTAALSQDVFKNHAIISVQGESEKLSIKHSALVKQYALTKEGFEFWQTLKKNTEQMGTIFDPMPSQVKGNINCITTPSEPVIGYISVSTISTARAFISKNELNQFVSKPTYTDCKLDSVFAVGYEFMFRDEKGPLIPAHEIIKDERVVGYMGGLPRCIDCTLRGTVNKPDFWQ